MSISIAAGVGGVPLVTVALFGAGVALFGTAVSVQAASVRNVHLTSSPSFTDNGLTLTASAALVGLGPRDVLVNLSATANATTICTNPSGRHQPPGQNQPRGRTPAQVSVSGLQVIPASEGNRRETTATVTT